mgnify:CR=1 FL=1
MLIQNKTGNLASFDAGSRKIDLLCLEWFEVRKRLLRRTTQGGTEVSIKFLQENPELTDGDVLYADDAMLIAVSILACNCIVLQPVNMFQMASVCYEIGNKHLPLFYDQDVLLVPFEKPLYKLLLAQGYAVTQEERKLLKPLKTTVSPHGNSDSLFSKIMKITG